jgi:hypothetical protein
MSEILKYEKSYVLESRKYGTYFPLRAALPNYLYPLDFPAKILCSFLISPVRATCSDPSTARMLFIMQFLEPLLRPMVHLSSLKQKIGSYSFTMWQEPSSSWNLYQYYLSSAHTVSWMRGTGPLFILTEAITPFLFHAGHGEDLVCSSHSHDECRPLYSTLPNKWRKEFKFH